jgi:monoamine oxidase
LTAQQRNQIGHEQLIETCMVQLQLLFGEDSKNILDIKIKDWSQDTNTSTAIDLISPMQHPQYPDALPRSFWDKKLIMAGTEVARQHGGYLEGALESADEAIAGIL